MPEGRVVGSRVAVRAEAAADLASLASEVAPELSAAAAEVASRLAAGRFHLSVVGEFKRGKSTLVNALLGRELLPTGVLPVTAVPVEVCSGAGRPSASGRLDALPTTAARTGGPKISSRRLATRRSASGLVPVRMPAKCQ